MRGDLGRRVALDAHALDRAVPLAGERQEVGEGLAGDHRLLRSPRDGVRVLAEHMQRRPPVLAWSPGFAAELLRRGDHLSNLRQGLSPEPAREVLGLQGGGDARRDLARRVLDPRCTQANAARAHRQGEGDPHGGHVGAPANLHRAETRERPAPRVEVVAQHDAPVLQEVALVNVAEPRQGEQRGGGACAILGRVGGQERGQVQVEAFAMRGGSGAGVLRSAGQEA